MEPEAGAGVDTLETGGLDTGIISHTRGILHVAQETPASWPRTPLHCGPGNPCIVHQLSQSLCMEGMFQALPQACWLRLSEPVTGNVSTKLMGRPLWKGGSCQAERSSGACGPFSPGSRRLDGVTAPPSPQGGCWAGRSNITAQRDAHSSSGCTAQLGGRGGQGGGGTEAGRERQRK